MPSEETKKPSEETLGWQYLLSTPAGRQVAARIIYDLCGIQAPSFPHGLIPDGHLLSLAMAKNEGRREVGMHLALLLQTADKEGYILMLQENVHVPRAK